MRGQTIRFNRSDHELGERVELPYPLRRALAWWVAAELIRRHPDELFVIETHPGGGQYDCVSVLHRGEGNRTIVDMNLAGHLTHHPVHPAESEERFNWFEVLNAKNRRNYVVRQLEAVTGLSSPTSTPATTRRSIGPRFLAVVAWQHALTAKRWQLVNGVLDSADMDGGVRKELFDQLGVQPTSEPGDLLGEPAYRYWFLAGARGRAILAVDALSGLLYPSGPPLLDDQWLYQLGSPYPIDLLQAYDECGRSLDLLSRRLSPPNL